MAAEAENPTPTLAELYEALSHARVTHKRAILQGNPTAAIRAAQYEYHLQQEIDAQLIAADDYPPIRRTYESLELDLRKFTIRRGQITA